MQAENNQNYQRWREVIEEWHTSGLTQSKFCAVNKLSYSRFKYFLYRLREIDESQKIITDVPAKTNHMATFEPVKLVASSAQQLAPPERPISKTSHREEVAFNVTLPNAIKLEVRASYSPASLKAMIEVLQQC